MALRIFVAHPSALLTDHQPHGDGLVAHGFLEGLALRGHELHVAAQDTDLRSPLPPNVRVHRLGLGAGDGVRARLGFMWRMRRLYTRLQPRVGFDLVHQLNPVDVGLSLAVADTRVPLVLGPYVPDWPRSGPGADGEVPLVSLQVKRLLRAAQQRRAALVLVSTPAALAKVAVDRARVRELSPGIDAQSWAPGGAPDAGHDVLFLANLHRRKGIHVMLDAFARTATAIPGARLLVAGAGPEQDVVRRRLRDERGLGRVTLLGHVGRSDALAAMQACSVYCLPSYGEPFGMTALEAMACAKPVVATAAGGLGHLVSDAGGRSVRPGDASALAGAVTELLSSPGLRRTMGEHNRRIVEAHYAWPRVIDGLEAIYHEAVASVGGDVTRAGRPPA